MSPWIEAGPGQTCCGVGHKGDKGKENEIMVGGVVGIDDHASRTYMQDALNGPNRNR